MGAMPGLVAVLVPLVVAGAAMAPRLEMVPLAVPVVTVPGVMVHPAAMVPRSAMAIPAVARWAWFRFRFRRFR